MMRILRLLPALLLAAASAWAAGVQNVQVLGTTPTQAILAFSVPDPNDCLVQVSTDPNFGSFVYDTDDLQFAGSQKCNRAGSVVDGNYVVFVAGLRTAQKGADNHFHSRALRCDTRYYFRILSQLQPENLPNPRWFRTKNPPLGAQYPEPPPFDSSLTAFGNYAWPEFDWTDPTKAVIDPLTGLEIKQFSRPAARALLEQNNTWSTPLDVNGKWTNATNAGSNGASFAASSAGIGANDYLFLPLPHFNSPTGSAVSGWNAGWGLEDILARVYGSATQPDGTNNVVALCLSKDSGQTCASKSFTVALGAGAGGATLVPASTPKPIFANWDLRADQSQKTPVAATVTVIGSTVSLINPSDGQFFDVSAAPGSKIFITGSSAMSPTRCVRDMCTVAAANSASTLTIAESCSGGGCPTNANYTGAAFGLRVTKATSSGSVAVSFGYDRATSTMTDAGVNGEQKYCSDNTLTVNTDRAGNAVSPALKGYLCVSGNSGLFLMIPDNADGTPRGEVRLLSLLETPGFTDKGVVVNSAALAVPWGGFDASDPNTFYAPYTPNGNILLLKGRYDTTKHDGDGRPCDYREWPLSSSTLYVNTLIGDCIAWSSTMDLTGAQPMDARSQMVRGYQTGRNANGAAVGPAHPGFDLSFMSLQPFVFIDGGLMSGLMSNGPNGTSSGLTVIGTFDIATGILTNVTDSFSQFPARWGNCHGCPITTAGTGRTALLNILQEGGNDKVLNGAWQMAPVKVNRAGAGSPPVWDTNTSLAWNEGYACPAGLTQDLIDIGGSGPNCVQVKVTSEPCAHNPNTTFHFLDGKTEGQEFPCSTTVNGVPVVPAGAQGWSKLQNMLPGDWVQDMAFGFLGGTERMAIATKTVNAANDIDMWMVRWMGCRGAKFPPGLNFLNQFGGCFYPSPQFTAISTHANGWTMRMSVPFSHGTDAGSAYLELDPTNAANPWISDNYAKAGGHSVLGTGMHDGNITFVGMSFPVYNVIFDKPFTAQAYTALFGTVTGRPLFSQKSNGLALLQNYPSNLQFKAEQRERVWSLDYRHYNPAFGGGAEYQGSILTNNQVPYTLNLQPGSTHTFEIATDATGLESMSQGPPDPKRIPMIGVAGRYLLKDVSGPATGDVFGDANAYSWCRAYQPNECRNGSHIGQLYVSVPGVAFSGSLGNLSLANGGAGYTSTPSVTITGANGTGSGASATASIFNANLGIVTFSIDNPGSGYTSNPTGTVNTCPDGSGSGAALNLAITAGRITFTGGVSGGGGYTCDPGVTVTGGGGSGAVITAHRSSGQIQQLTLSSAGAGYAMPIVVTFNGGGGTGASATASIGGLNCYSNQYPRNTPCVFSNSPAGANIMQFDVSRPDPQGKRQRRLGYGLAGPLRQYEFDNARPTPDGKYMIFPGNWVDGLRRELMLAKLPPWPMEDGVDRTDFVAVPIQLGPNASAPNARIRFGYAENGPSDSLFCTTRRESCSTEIPAGAPGDPYSFVGEPRTFKNCRGGCSISIPAISGRVLYYVVERLDAAGNVLDSSPPRAQAVQ
jgi:hypothetical protein